MLWEDPPKRSRQFLRAPFPSPVELRLGHRDYHEGTLACDLSQGGIKCYINEFVPVGTVMMVQLTLQGEMVELSGQVSWVKQVPHSERYQIGVQFDEFQQFERQRIAEHVFFE